MKKKRFSGKAFMVYLIIVILTAALNVAAWNSTAFSDWYIAYIFPVWVNLYGRVTGVFSFSVGEWMLAAGVLVAALALALGIVWGCICVGKGICFVRDFLAGGTTQRKCLVGRFFAGRAKGETWLVRNSHACCAEEGQTPSDPGKARGTEGRAGETCGPRGELSQIAGKGPAGKFRSFSRRFYLFFLWTLLIVGLVMTLNCFILYHASTFSEHYFGEDEGEYTLEELIGVYNMAAERCNYLAGIMERDDDGMVLYGGSVGRDGETLDMADRARQLMEQLGETYPQLDGFYPRPKALLSSDFMCQQYMQGYYFPFSMEANYNDVMHILNVPSTMCHELAHLRGYIYEDEANFIGYLACVQSEDAFFQYAGYLSVLTYLNNDLYKAWENSRTAFEEATAILRPVAVETQVWEDNVFVTQEEWDRINGKALIDTEIVDKAADVFIDTNLKLNGVADGKVSYSRVVRLLLQYYRVNPLQETGAGR